MNPVQRTFRIHSLSPLMLAAGPPAHNLLTTLEYIPGSTVLGLFAAQYLQNHPVDSLFQEIFLSGKVSFGWATLENSEVLPLSARSCKYDDKHSLRDALTLQAQERCCASCQAPLVSAQGFWKPDAQERLHVQQRTILRTAIDSVRGSASFGQLYSSQVLAEDQTFFGSIEGPEELVQELDPMLAQSFNTAIGRGRSRGQGWVEVTKADKPPVCRSPSQAAARSKASQSKDLILTLLSAALFTDDYLRDCGEPTIEDLAPLGICPNEWEPRPYKIFAAPQTLFGFDGEPLYLPRRTRRAVQAGSVFCFRPCSEETQVSPVQGEGLGWIGEGKGEGLGRAMLWHPFHLPPQDLS